MSGFAIPSSADQLLSRARELAGTPDIVDADIEEKLHRLLRSLNGEARLSKAGARVMELRLLRWLRNRLRLLRDLRRHPEILDESIHAPLILLGLPRTASSKLHHLLAASGDFRFLPFWQGHTLGPTSGNRCEDPAARIREAEDFIRQLYEREPAMKVAHPYATFAPEEETLLFEHQLIATVLTPYVEIPEYLAWYRARDLRPDVEFFKQALQYIQWQFSADDARPWLLKSPGHSGREPLLAELFPGARFVYTIREPISLCSSGASLVTCFHRTYSDFDWREQVGPRFMQGFAMQAERHLSVRDAHPELDFLDIGYRESTEHAESAVEKIYAHADITLSDEARTAMRAWETENRQHKLGVHAHRLDDYALSPALVGETFGRYIERFEQYF
jgi:Sulfotransferase family